MPDPEIGLKLPTEASRPSFPVSKSAAEWASHAESLGYTSIWMSEGWGAHTPMELATASMTTSSIRLCTAVLNVYARTPIVLAMAGATLQRLSDGRAILGVGPSHESAVRSLYGGSYDRPVRRTHETIKVIKELTGGTDSITFDGEVVQVTDVPAMDEPVPVYNAALREANRRATGRVADGWLPFMFPVSALEEAFETVERTARERNRDPDDIRVTPQIIAAVNEDREEAKDAVRRFIATYIGALPNYRNGLKLWFPETANAIGDAWEAGGLEAAMDAVTEEVLFELGIAGTSDEAIDQLTELLANPTIDEPILYVPRDVPPEARDRTIRTLAPEHL